MLRPENRERLGGSGRVVWLTAAAATLAERLRQDAATAGRRPALTRHRRALWRRLPRLLAIREPWYRACADLVVTTDGRMPDAVADEVLAWWNGG